MNVDARCLKSCTDEVQSTTTGKEKVEKEENKVQNAGQVRRCCQGYLIGRY